ncbi:hypothetical protein [Nitratireductor alexandrii]|uniref:hypothetical protein n=1 Tax=Nitratireductor alexandrii TaxID=2448161 RepID=UPI000FD8C9BF|nr:hypothetical protein [Nitratireductor alexandrii]
MDISILNNAFFQARLKVNRADRHFQEAQAWFKGYIESDFCKLIEERDPETGGQSFRVEAAPIPPDLVLAIGDTFHSLSCAIDYVMTGMARAAGISAARVGFPTDETRQALRQSFIAPKKAGAKDPPKRRIMKTFPAFVMLLLQSIKPYRGGNFLLWEVRKVDNIDKHNLIVPSVTISELRGVSLLDKTYNNSFGSVNAKVGAGGRVNLVMYNNPGGKLKVTNKGQASASITFAQSMEVFPGESVFPTLLQCIQAVDQAISLIERVGTKPYIAS